MNDIHPINQRDQFLLLFDHLSDCTIVMNDIGNVIYLNPIAETIFGFKNSEIRNQSISVLIANYKMENRLETSLIGLRGENRFPFPIKVISHSLLCGNENYHVILVKDLQDDKKITEQLKMVSKELADIKLALDESTIIAITDPKGTITLVNEKFCELSKYNANEVIGENHRILNSGYHSKEFFREMWNTIANGKTWKGEIQNKAKDGSLYWVDTTVVPFLNDKGKPYQYISIRTDITKRVKMEKELQEALKKDFNHTVKNLQNGIFRMKKNEVGHLVYTMAEGKLMDKIGANSELLFNKSPRDVFPAEIANLKQLHYEKAFDGHRVNYEVELRGKLLYVDVSPIFQDDTVYEIVGSVHDITELRSTQRQLQVNQQHYQSLFAHSQDAVITYDTNGKIIDMNPKAKNLFSCSEESASHQPNEYMIASEYQSKRNSCFEKAIQGHPQNFEIEMINKLGKRLFLNLTYLPIIVDKQIKGIYSIGKDITEQKKIQETNAYLAHHDELTKLPNRRWIEQKLRESLTHAEKNNQEIAVLFIDLDRFKYINDTLGHLIGDRLLEQISRRLQQSIDPNRHFLGRMGGDEFMLVCPAIDHHERTFNLARNLLDQLTNPFYIEEYELFVSASIGISIYPFDGENVVDLMKKADIALYRAKDQGRNTYQVYAHSKDDRSYQSFLLERDLRKAIINNEFIAYFQPRVDARTGETVSAEALIRWMHPEFGLISPGEFIPLAEETGLIIPIGKWMKKKVCEHLVTWREEGIPLIPISVNISSQRFLQNEFALEVRQLLEQYQLDGKWLEFEITENSLMKNEEYILQTLHDLKGLGIKIFIDDFGTGYSSFHYLKSFKLDGIKIDRSFIRNISSESENAGITTAMIKMAKHLKMEVIAEGVETEEELVFLLEQNCHQIQGFYFGKPCSMEEFEEKFIGK